MGKCLSFDDKWVARVSVSNVHLTGWATFLLHHTLHTPTFTHLPYRCKRSWIFISQCSSQLTLTWLSLFMIISCSTRASNIRTLKEDGESAEEEEFDRGIQRAGTGTSSLYWLNVTHLFQWAESKQHHNRGQKRDLGTHRQRHGSHADAGCLRRRSTVPWRPDSELPCVFMCVLCLYALRMKASVGF